MPWRNLDRGFPRVVDARALDLLGLLPDGFEDGPWNPDLAMGDPTGVLREHTRAARAALEGQERAVQDREIVYDDVIDRVLGRGSAPSP